MSLIAGLASALALNVASAPIDDLFSPVNRPDGPGCAIDVRRKGDIVAQRVFGAADLESARSINADTIFEAGSVSKQFVGAAVARLAVDGRLSLDDRLVRWIPELPPLYADITLRQLLTHTSGIRGWDNLAELEGWPRGTRVYTQDWALRVLARQRALNFRPGAEYLYSNGNYVLAAIVVERASGESLNAYTRRVFFAPIGMTRTSWRDDFRRVVPGRARAYGTAGSGGWRLDEPIEDVVGPGGLMTTVGDLQRWNAVLADPGPVDRPWVDLVMRPGVLADGTLTGYGLGVELIPVAGRPAVSHAGATASYHAWLGRFPDDGLSVALLCNAGSLNTEELGPQLAALFLPPQPPAARPARALGPTPAELAGRYRNAISDGAVDATVDATGLRFNGGAAFTRTGADQLATSDGRRTGRIARSAGGAVREVTLSRIGNAPVRLIKTTPWTPTAAELDAFVGRYRSHEVEGEHRIERTGAGLRWIDPVGASHPLTPTYPDGFEAPDNAWILRFARDARAVTSFSATLTRTRRVQFDRTP